MAAGRRKDEEFEYVERTFQSVRDRLESLSYKLNIERTKGDSPVNFSE